MVITRPAIVTVDEADQPLINQIFDEKLSEKERDEKITNTIESFNQFYGFIKGKIPNQIRNVTVAGHSMIAKSSIYSGFYFQI